MRLIVVILAATLAACGPPTEAQRDFFKTYDQRLPDSRIDWPDQRPRFP